MLDLRPTCEHCRRPLSPDGTGATICSYECTFCISCAEQTLSWVCPNCGGALVPRPPRPTELLAENPGSMVEVYKPAELENHHQKVAKRMTAAGRQPHLWEIVVDCSDPAGLARFYGELLGVEATIESSTWAYLEPHSRGPLLAMGGQPPAGTRLAFQQVPEAKQGKVRLHIDIGTWDLAAAAVAAVTLGGSRLGEPQQESGGSYFQVMADPEGHEFCFVDP